MIAEFFYLFYYLSKIDLAFYNEISHNVPFETVTTFNALVPCDCVGQEFNFLLFRQLLSCNS